MLDTCEAVRVHIPLAGAVGAAAGASSSTEAGRTALLQLTPRRSQVLLGALPKGLSQPVEEGREEAGAAAASAAVGDRTAASGDGDGGAEWPHGVSREQVTCFINERVAQVSSLQTPPVKSRGLPPSCARPQCSEPRLSVTFGA